MEDAEIVIYLKNQISTLEKKLYGLNREIEALNVQKESVQKALNAYQTTLEFEVGPLPDTPPSDLQQDCTSLSIFDAADLILSVRNGLSEKELYEAMTMRGKKLKPDNATVVIGTALRRSPNFFEKKDGKWFKKR